MTDIQNTDIKTQFQIRGVELLNGTLNLPLNIQPNVNFNFEIRIESKADTENKLVFVVVTVHVQNEDKSLTYGSLAVSCIYHIINYDEVIKVVDNRLDMPKPLIDALNSISISTTRGVMFSTFKGTFLHNAILPIVDPKQFTNMVQQPADK